MITPPKQLPVITAESKSITDNKTLIFLIILGFGAGVWATNISNSLSQVKSDISEIKAAMKERVAVDKAEPSTAHIPKVP